MKGLNQRNGIPLYETADVSFSTPLKFDRHVIIPFPQQRRLTTARFACAA